MKKTLTEFEIISKRKKKMQDKRYVLDRKYSKMLGLRKDKLESKKHKEIERFERKWKKMMDIELHNLTHTRKRKELVDKTISKPKADALKEIQLYSKLSRAELIDGKVVVFLWDKLISVPLDKKVNGGHVYSQKNYPQLAFCEINIRPISSWGNRKQGDTTAERRKNLPKEIQGYLESESKKKILKNQIRDRYFYENITQIYKEKNKKEIIRLGLN